MISADIDGCTLKTTSGSSFGCKFKKLNCVEENLRSVLLTKTVMVRRLTI
jgi:hypothetical protein